MPVRVIASSRATADGSEIGQEQLDIERSNARACLARPTRHQRGAARAAGTACDRSLVGEIDVEPGDKDAVATAPAATAEPLDGEVGAAARATGAARGNVVRAEREECVGRGEDQASAATTATTTTGTAVGRRGTTGAASAAHEHVITGKDEVGLRDKQAHATAAAATGRRRVLAAVAAAATGDQVARQRAHATACAAGTAIGAVAKALRARAAHTIGFGCARLRRQYAAIEHVGAATLPVTRTTHARAVAKTDTALRAASDDVRSVADLGHRRRRGSDEPKTHQRRPQSAATRRRRRSPRMATRPRRRQFRSHLHHAQRSVPHEMVNAVHWIPLENAPSWLGREGTS